MEKTIDMSKYVRLTKGVKDRGILIKPDDIYKHIDNANEDWYTSIYYYTDEHLKSFKEKGTIAGIIDVKTDKLVFDFDGPTDMAAAKNDAVELVNRLSSYKIKPSNLEIYFSGNKGFTVVLKLDRQITPKESKLIAIEKLGKGLPTLDSSIYNASRILRVPATRHPSSGLYKIPLTFDELKSLEVVDIKSKAKTLDSIDEEYFVEEPSKIDDKLYEVKITKEEPKDSTKYGFDTSEIDVENRPSYLDKARWLLVNGFFKEGNRSTALLCLASTFKNVGYDKEVVYRMLKGVAEIQAKRTGEERFDDGELYNKIILQVYGPHWKGGQFTTRDPGSWLYTYAKEMGVIEETKNEPITVDKVNNSFTHYVKNIDKNTIKTGIASLDEVMTFNTGMMASIVGAPGSGKTAISLEILRNTSKNGVLSVFASLDMHRNRLFEKLLYKVTGLPREEIYEAYQNNSADHLTKAVKEEYGNVWFYDRSSPSVQDIRDYVLDVERQTGEKVKLVVLDYFERISSEMSDETASSKNVAGALQDMMNDLDVCIIVLVQPNKMAIGSGPDSPILNYSAIKGSSFLSQSFRAILSIWRPFYNPEWKLHDKYMQMGILKNDLGEIGVLDYKWDGRTGNIRELEDFERMDFERLLEEKNTKEKEKW